MAEPDPLGTLDEASASTARLVASLDGLSAAGLREESALAGWTRGHVLTHLARNADSLARLLCWAATGDETPQYASRDGRDAEIAAGAARPLAEQLADLEHSTTALAAAARQVPESRWEYPVRTLSGSERTARHLLWARWRELEVHHVDLGLGYGSADWPATFTTRLLDDVVAGLRGRPDAPDVLLEGRDSGRRFALGAAVLLGVSRGDPERHSELDAAVRTVTGPEHRLAAWLTGRSSGKMLVVTPAGPLPPVPPWL